MHTPLNEEESESVLSWRTSVCATDRRLSLTRSAISYIAPFCELEVALIGNFRFCRVEPSVVESIVLETSIYNREDYGSDLFHITVLTCQKKQVKTVILLQTGQNRNIKTGQNCNIIK